MTKLHSKSCYGCKFAVEFRDHIRHGEQVRCGWAEEEFGGTRWVDVRKGVNGDVLKSKCGQFKSFLEDGELFPETPKEYEPCKTCTGSGSVKIKYLYYEKLEECKKCKGTGEVEL